MLKITFISSSIVSVGDILFSNRIFELSELPVLELTVCDLYVSLILEHGYIRII